MLFKVEPVAKNRRASQSVVASRSVCEGQNFCRSASATHCNWQFLLVGWCELGLKQTEQLSNNGLYCLERNWYAQYLQASSKHAPINDSSAANHDAMAT